jgi:hypothetical protein
MLRRLALLASTNVSTKAAASIFRIEEEFFARSSETLVPLFQI